MNTQPPGPIPLSAQARDELMDIYKVMWDTWRSQVDSYWQRSGYFALFETAAIGGCWYLVSGRRLLDMAAGAGASILGIALTDVWHRNNDKTHIYVRHWWDAIRTIEGRVNLAPNDFAEQLEQNMERLNDTHYRDLIQRVPRLFNIVWVALFLIAVARGFYFAFHWRIL